MGLDENIPHIRVDINMSNGDYLIWNLEGAIRKLRTAPKEKEITLMVYNIHREILKKRGVSESDLAKCDAALEEVINYGSRHSKN